MSRRSDSPEQECSGGGAAGILAAAPAPDPGGLECTMAALVGDMAVARRMAREAFIGFARGGGRALYLCMGAGGLSWLDSLTGGMPETASVGVFLDIAEVPRMVAAVMPKLVVIDPANSAGADEGWAHARALGAALYELDALLAKVGGRGLLVCEAYGVPGAPGAGRVRCLAQLRRFCGKFVDCGVESPRG